MFENAAGLAEGYYQENQREVGDNTAVMAGDISKKLMQVPIESREFQDYYYLQVLSRNLNESAIIEIGADNIARTARSEEHTSELQSLMRISYAVFSLTKKHTSITK